jgi:hypothetical protein
MQSGRQQGFNAFQVQRLIYKTKYLIQEVEGSLSIHNFTQGADREIRFSHSVEILKFRYRLSTMWGPSPSPAYLRTKYLRTLPLKAL